jgi:type II secretory pathway pseudopilin PulG
MISAAYRQLQRQNGSALLVVLVMVVIVGLSTGIAGRSWQSIVQRADEAELFWRGDQYRRAIRSYYEYGGGDQRKFVGQYPARLEDLLKDPRSLATRKHIRQLYPDPLTGGEWVLIKDEGGRVVGVQSGSELEPFQQDGFLSEYESFAGASTYAAWKFQYYPKPKPTAANVAPESAAPGSGENR